MFETVLIANRGEIARRVARTLRRLGIRSVVVFTDPDAGAPHVREADAAVRASSYLAIDEVVAAGVGAGAEAVHPGYGFLSESPAFARACADAGLVFVGPGEHALIVMGDKIRAKAHVAAHGVPVVPGFSAVGMSDAQLAEAAADAGFPLLVKPSAGGGGKGMQVVRTTAELPVALAAARRIAAAAFGDDALLLERLIERPRHIEVQVLADAHGAVIHLGERECTLQRRHQKVVEEAPSPIVDAELRGRLGAAAVAAARSVGYRGVGTVEFLVAADRPDQPFFIEMNTRLQVEHPVTELVTGLDLVECQLRAAAGEPLALGQDDVRIAGHAVEARVYAESPARGFLPSAGEVLSWAAGPGARTDAAVETGTVVTADYDPMIAKVIAHGADRADALARLDAALAGTVVLGVDTNLAFLRALLADPVVRSGDLDTALIDRMPPFVDPVPSARALRAAADAVTATPGPGTASALWRSRSGWRLGGPPASVPFAVLTDDGVMHTGSAPADASRAAVTAIAAGGTVWVHADGTAHRLVPLTRREAMERRLSARAAGETASDPAVRAPMPGTVVAVHAADGATVAAGDRIATIEAMKMEHSVVAPHDGILRVHVAVGSQVRRDDLLAAVDPAAADPASTRLIPAESAGDPGEPG